MGHVGARHSRKSDNEADMNTSLSDDLHRWADEEPAGPKKNRLQCAALRARIMEEAAHKRNADSVGAKVVVFPRHKPMRAQFLESLEALGPKDTA